MKKIKFIILCFVCLIVLNVKADMGAPAIITYKAMITNKDGAYCYIDGKKTDTVIPYKTVFEVYNDVYNGYVYISNSQYNCDVKSSDLSALSNDFDINNSEVESITPVKAIVLAKGGLNMRKGPAVSYSKMLTIPQYSVVTLKLKAGTFWYYTEYNGKSGWITGMDNYLGIENNKVLIENKDVNIFDSKEKIIGKIPANTEVTDYVDLVGYPYYSYAHYVNYNGVKGYLNEMMLKTETSGKIKIVKDVNIVDEEGHPVKKILANNIFTYDMKFDGMGLYLNEDKTLVYLDTDQYEYIEEAKLKVKEKGYLGEGLFGEEKVAKVEEDKPIETISDEAKNKTINTSEIIIISLLAGIFLALTALVCIKLINSKKKNEEKKDEQ